MERHISPVGPAERDDAGEAVNQWSREEEAMRRPSLRTSLPLTGHSLANRSALNSSNRAPKTQHRRHSTVKLAVHAASTQDSRCKCQIYKRTNAIKMFAVIHT